MPAHTISLSQQRQQLIEKLRDIDQPEAIRRYFGLLKELIEIVNLPNGDARLAFVVSRDRRTISASINFFLALQLYRPRNGEVEFWLTVKKDCKEVIESLVAVDTVPLSEKSDYVSAIIGQSSAYLLNQPLLRKCWEDCLRELLETSKRGPHTARHNSYMYQAADDDALREELMAAIVRPEHDSPDGDLTDGVAEAPAEYGPVNPLHYLIPHHQNQQHQIHYTLQH